MSKIVIVEDDEWLASSYQRIVASAGHEVCVTRDGHDAIRSIEAVKPDCIISDILLNDHTVIGLLHELQSYSDTARIPVIVCSAFTHPAISMDAFRFYGVVAVLEKTILTPEALLRAITEAVT